MQPKTWFIFYLGRDVQHFVKIFRNSADYTLVLMNLLYVAAFYCNYVYVVTYGLQCYKTMNVHLSSL